MKAINVHFEDGEFKKLVKIKKDMSWHDFIMYLVEKNGK